MGKTGRGAGAGVGDRWIKPRDRELRDHVMYKTDFWCAALNGMASRLYPRSYMRVHYKWSAPDFQKFAVYRVGWRLST